MRREKSINVRIPEDCFEFREPKPKCVYYSYNYPESQGALICQTDRFPKYVKQTVTLFDAYSDRVMRYDSDRYFQAVEFLKSGCQSWAYKLQHISQDDLKKFAQILLGMPETPDHVRVVHYYNVSSGYSCPYVIAFCKKPTKPKAS